MRRIQGQLTKELSARCDLKDVAAAGPYFVPTYRELVEHIARLAYLNGDYLLFFRGQGRDFLNKANKSTFYPTIYRDDNLAQRELDHRFELLASAVDCLKREIEHDKSIEGRYLVRRKRYIQWSVLQHYQVCGTPLLDFTQSIRVACSFASLDHPSDVAYIYVFGLPYLTNLISANSEHDLVNVRLLGICPPQALRPYFQEGFLAGTEDITNEYDRKVELDFNNRLIAKFSIPTDKSFWARRDQSIPDEWLYPKNDRMEAICMRVRELLRTQLRPGDLGEFIREWSELEDALVQIARRRGQRVFSVLEAIRYLEKQRVLSADQAKAVHDLRQVRNQFVHTPNEAEPSLLGEYQKRLRDISPGLIKHLQRYSDE